MAGVGSGNKVKIIAFAIAAGALLWWYKRRNADDSDDAASGGADLSDNPPLSNDEAMPGSLSGRRYLPNASETVDLFTQAAAQAGLPTDWAASGGPLHLVLKAESGGWVGIPNLQFGALSSPQQISQWPTVWAAIQNGTWRSLIDQSKVSSAGMSSATGLGQLTMSNIPKYYPSGLQGIGQPIEEAIGMLAYIADRYGDPDAAWAHEQQFHWY